MFKNFNCEKYFTCILLHCMAHQITKELYLHVTAGPTILQTVHIGQTLCQCDEANHSQNYHPGFFYARPFPAER